MNMRIYESVVQGRELLESSKVAHASAIRQAGWSIITVLLILIAAALINSSTMGRAITERVRRLREGAALIGSGDLKHRIDVKGDDEFAEVSGAFNAMTAKLSGSYRNLEEEIEVRKRAEEAVRASGERLALATSATQIGMFDWDLAKGTVLWTQTHEAIFGYAAAATTTTSSTTTTTTTTTTEHHYSRWADRVHPEDLPNVEAESRRCIQDRKPLEVQYRIIWPDDSLHWVETRGVFQYDSDGKASRMHGVVMDITERKRVEVAINTSLHEKEVLLKEIHHRVKNNLQVISSLVSLQAEGSQNETVLEVLKDVTFRVRSMALVHEKLYQSGDLAKIDFTEYIESLMNYLWRSHGPLASSIRLIFDLEPVSLPVDTAVPCGLILNELAGNALKHAFRGKSDGEVAVSLKNGKDERIHLSVTDNGVGLPEGFDWKLVNSLGLRLVQMLTRQIDAEVEVDGGDGTRFEIVFQIKS